MILRTKRGDFGITAATLLLDFFGEKAATGGFPAEVEVIATVPFALTKGEAGEDRVAWTFSTFDLDRVGERIDPAGWDFKRFLDNPVVEWAHRYDIPAIGRAEGLFADGKGLHGVVVFNDKDYDPFGWAVGERVKHGVIRAGSVGFRPLEIELPDKETAKDGTVLVFRKQELVEFSVCNVPANPFALSKGWEQKKQSELAPFWGNFIGGING
jgi:HK97 family phage prohead protease